MTIYPDADLITNSDYFTDRKLASSCFQPQPYFAAWRNFSTNVYCLISPTLLCFDWLVVAF